MIKKEINLSNTVDFFKKNQVTPFDKDIDEYGGYFITAAILAAVIISPDPVTKIAVFCEGIHAGSLRASKLFSWLPDRFKYKDRGREKSAIHRYELASYVNFVLLQIAIKDGIKEIIMPQFKVILSSLELTDEDRKELDNISRECDKERATLNLPLNCSLSKDDISSQAFKIIDPILSTLYKLHEERKAGKISIKKIELAEIKEAFLNHVTILYQAFLINFSNEFPEFALWADITQKAKIIEELRNASKTIQAENKIENEKFIHQTEKLIAKIEELRDNSFIKENGFPSFVDIYQKMFKVQKGTSF